MRASKLAIDVRAFALTGLFVQLTRTFTLARLLVEVAWRLAFHVGAFTLTGLFIDVVWKFASVSRFSAFTLTCLAVQHIEMGGRRHLAVLVETC